MSSRILSGLQKRTNEPLNIQLNQQSTKKLLLYSKPYNTLWNPHAFAFMPFGRVHLREVSLQVTFSPFSLLDSPACRFLCNLLDCKDTSFQFWPHWRVPLGHSRVRGKLLFWLITQHATPAGKRWMISQPTGAHVNRNTCYQHPCGLLKGTMETTLFPHAFRSIDKDIFYLACLAQRS